MEPTNDRLYGPTMTMAGALAASRRMSCEQCVFCGRPTRNRTPFSTGGRSKAPACPGGRCRNRKGP